MADEEDVLFREEQRFREPWVLALVVLMPACLTAVFGYGMVQQIVFDRPWGTKPMTDGGLLATGALVILFALAIPVMFVVTRLVTVVRRDGLYVRFVPFHRRRRKLAPDGVQRCEAVTYAPIRQYGGWGIRKAWRGPGRAYNVSGNRGVRLEYEDGRHVLVGSQRAEELAEAVNAILPGGRLDAARGGGRHPSPDG